MQKKLVFLFVVIFLSIGFVSSFQVSSNSNILSGGQNLVIKVSGNFYYPLTDSDVSFYRNGQDVSFLHNFTKINGDYYVSLQIPAGRTPGNYSVKVDAVQNYLGEPDPQNVTEKFVIIDSTASFTISPPLSILKNYIYTLSISNIGHNLPLNISYYNGTANTSIFLNAGESKKVRMKNYGGNKFEVVSFTSQNQTYSAIVYSNLTSTTSPVNVINSNSSSNSSVISNGSNQTNQTANQTNSTSLWNQIFGKGSSSNSTNSMNVTNTTNTSVNTQSLQTCSEMNLSICNSTEKCSGSLVDGLNAQCCNGTCAPQKSKSSAWKTIGWIILGVAVIFLIWFFKTKYSKAKRSPKKLLKK